MGKIIKVSATHKPVMNGVQYVKTFNDFEITRRAKSDPDAPLLSDLKGLKRVKVRNQT